MAKPRRCQAVMGKSCRRWLTWGGSGASLWQAVAVAPCVQVIAEVQAAWIWWEVQSSCPSVPFCHLSRKILYDFSSLGQSHQQQFHMNETGWVCRNNFPLNNFIQSPHTLNRLRVTWMSWQWQAFYFSIYYRINHLWVLVWCLHFPYPYYISYKL